MDNAWQPLIQSGAVGAVLVWFMFKSEPRLRAMEAAIDRLARAILLLIIAIPTGSAAIRGQAEGIVKEIDDAKVKL